MSHVGSETDYNTRIELEIPAFVPTDRCFCFRCASTGIGATHDDADADAVMLHRQNRASARPCSSRRDGNTLRQGTTPLKTSRVGLLLG